jgi:hypothetical protein
LSGFFTAKRQLQTLVGLDAVTRPMGVKQPHTAAFVAKITIGMLTRTETARPPPRARELLSAPWKSETITELITPVVRG